MLVQEYQNYLVSLKKQEIGIVPSFIVCYLIFKHAPKIVQLQYSIFVTNQVLISVIPTAKNTNNSMFPFVIVNMNVEQVTQSHFKKKPILLSVYFRRYSAYANIPDALSI